MRRFLLPGLAATLALGLAACAPYGASSQRAVSNAPSSVPCGPTPDPSAFGTGCLPGGSPTFTTGPGGSPIGTWSLTLVGGPSAGTYAGSDEMICTGVAGGPMSVSFQPVGSPRVLQVDATTNAGASLMLISAGGIEMGGTYQAATGQQGQTVRLGHASIRDGALSLAISGTQRFPGEGPVREIQLTVDCPLFPAEPGG